MRKFPFIQTSVFIDDRFPFSGNQLATFWNLSDEDLTTEEMQGITQEMNFSETTFVLPSTHPKCVRKVRIFTPGREIPFAGHPTLGTAFVLKREGIIKDDDSKAYLELGIGPTTVRFSGQNHIQMIQANPEFLEEFPNKTVISEVLGIAPSYIEDRWPIQFVSTGFPFLIVPLTSLKAIQAIRLDTGLLLEVLEDFPSQALDVFTCDTVHPDSHVHVRMFAPDVGVLEDPATGSAAGPLGTYLETYECLSNRARGAEIVLEQGYEILRPSKLHVECRYEEGKISEAIVGGQVRLTAEGVFFL
ncbi:MAG: PhzF family phenazine biosynthesis protein [Candidatus Heimdallarchaeota archaeon]